MGVVFNALVFLVLFSLLIFSIYFLWVNLPTPPQEFETFTSITTENISTKSSQFYPNMRYPDRIISYSFSESCDQKKRTDGRAAFALLQQKTILMFNESLEAQIEISCENIAPQPTQENHFVAGEGGPTEIINATRYAVITSGKIALYRPESCKTPQVATHEILHALGFDHNAHKTSIIYPVTNCRQTIDAYIIEEINNLYRDSALSDLVIERVKANKTGRYLNIEVIIANDGLKEAKNAFLDLSANEERVKTFDIGNYSIGTKRIITVTNIYIPRETNRVSFVVYHQERELSKENNGAVVNIRPRQSSSQ